MKRIAALLTVAVLAACAAARPAQQGGAASVPATQGGGAGPMEGSPLNARNLGTGPTSTVGQ